MDEIWLGKVCHAINEKRKKTQMSEGIELTNQDTIKYAAMKENNTREKKSHQRDKHLGCLPL